MTKEKFLDPNIPNKSKTVEEKFNCLVKIYFYLYPEIEIGESVRATESVVVRSAPDFLDKKEFISNKLHERLCTQPNNLILAELLDIVDLWNHLLIKIFII